MSAAFAGRIRPSGSAGLGLTRRGGRCEFDFSDLTLDLNDEQARALRDGLVSLYGPPAAIQHQLQAKPARRLAEDALPPEALVVLHSLSDAWIDTASLGASMDQPQPDAALRRLLYMLHNAGKIERRVTPMSARHGNFIEWRRK